MKTRPSSVRSFIVLLLVPLALLTTGFAPPGDSSAPGATWRFETSAPSYSRNPSIAVDSQNRPHVAYCSANEVRYASRGASAWSNELVLSEYCVKTALAIDVNDEPHIAYEHAGLKYAHYTGGAWHVETVDSQSLEEGKISIALDSGRRPHILYSIHTAAGGVLKYAHLSGSTWLIETINAGDTVHPSGKSDLALDAADRPHICYATFSADVIKYGYKAGSAWHFEPIVSNSGFSPCSLALDVQGHPHISYASADMFGEMGLIYAYHNGSGWQRTRLDSRSYASNWAGSSLALDKAGRPRIAYEVSTAPAPGDQLRYMVFDGAAWHTDTVATLADTMYDDVMLALDGNGQPHISYQVHGEDRVTYATKDIPILSRKAYLPLIIRR